MVTDEELDEMEAEIRRKMKKGGSSSVSQMKSVLNRGEGDSTRTFLPAMVSEEEMQEMLKDIEKKKKERKRQGLKTMR
jgi:predicted DNA-binding ArsR family transcriptional regulator